jgi:hypothetical protein
MGEKVHKINANITLFYVKDLKINGFFLQGINPTTNSPRNDCFSVLTLTSYRGKHDSYDKCGY